MGCVEALVHGYDIAQGLGLGLDPPRHLCRRVLARLFPQAAAELTDADPWEALQWATGAPSFPGIHGYGNGAGTVLRSRSSKAPRSSQA